MIFAQFNRLLKQLRLCIELKHISVNECVNVYDVEVKNDNEISVNDLRFRIGVNFGLVLRPIKVSIPVGDNCSAISFRVDGEITKENLEENPSKSPRMPLNKELFQDWIYCHNHGDKEAHDANEIDEELTKFNSINQIEHLLKQQNVASKLLFESDNKSDNLVVNVINTGCLIGSCFETNKSDLLNVDLRPAIGLQYKVLSVYNQELKAFRHSFNVDFHVLNNELFCEFKDRLISSTKLVVSDDHKKDEEDFYCGYFICNH